MTKTLTGIENNYNILMMNKFKGLYRLLSTVVQRRRHIANIYRKRTCGDIAYYFYYWMIINKKIHKDKSRNRSVISGLDSFKFILEFTINKIRLECFYIIKGK